MTLGKTGYFPGSIVDGRNRAHRNQFASRVTVSRRAAKTRTQPERWNATPVLRLGADHRPRAESILEDQIGCYVQDATKRQLTFSADWLRRKRYKAADLKVMPVHGDSMLLKLADGDTVLVNTADTRVVDGRIYALVLVAMPRSRHCVGARMVRSENPDKASFPDEVIEADTAVDVPIIGRAVQRAGDLRAGPRNLHSTIGGLSAS